MKDEEEEEDKNKIKNKKKIEKFSLGSWRRIHCRRQTALLYARHSQSTPRQILFPVHSISSYHSTVSPSVVQQASPTFISSDDVLRQHATLHSRCDFAACTS